VGIRGAVGSLLVDFLVPYALFWSVFLGCCGFSAERPSPQPRPSDQKRPQSRTFPRDTIDGCMAMAMAAATAFPAWRSMACPLVARRDRLSWFTARPGYTGTDSRHTCQRTRTSPTTSPTSLPTRRGVLLLPPTLLHLLLGLVLGVIIQQGGGCGIRRMTTLVVIPALSCGPLYTSGGVHVSHNYT
jgi:hypothetical protein